MPASSKPLTPLNLSYPCILVPGMFVRNMGLQEQLLSEQVEDDNQC